LSAIRHLEALAFNHARLLCTNICKQGLPDKAA
jgi:hypothetical protein